MIDLERLAGIRGQGIARGGGFFGYGIAHLFRTAMAQGIASLEVILF